MNKLIISVKPNNCKLLEVSSNAKTLITTTDNLHQMANFICAKYGW